MTRMFLVCSLVCSLVAACASHAKRGSSSPDSAGRSSPPSSGAAPTGASMTPPPPAADECPSLQIKAPDSASQGTALRVQAIATGGAPTFQWTVSAGKIAMGQGTASIQIDTKGLAGMSVTATVALGNIGARCEATTASATTLVGP